MKKFFLSAFIIVTFVAYTFHQHTGGDDSLPVIPPTLPASTPTPTTSQSSSSFPTESGPSPTPSPTPTRTTVNGYKDGQYTGDVTDAYYGNVQIKATILNGKITDVQFLDYPHDRQTSVMINTQAMPYLKSEAIQVQNANVDIVSGATETSLAFRKSLLSALNMAK